MINKLLENRLACNMTRPDLIDTIHKSYSDITKAVISTLISQIEAGKYPWTMQMETAEKYCSFYNMTADEFKNAVNTNSKNINNSEFINEYNNVMHNGPRYRKRHNEVKESTVTNFSKIAAKKLFDKCIAEGFFNTLDKTLYNKYCKENNIVNLTVNEWHIIKAKLDEEFKATHNGMTESAFKYYESLKRSASRVGFGDDYNKYQRWIKYCRKYENPMSIEEWSKYDDEKMIGYKDKRNNRTEKDLIRLKKQTKQMHDANKIRAKNLGLKDEQQYYRWIEFHNNKEYAHMSLEEFLVIDKQRQSRIKQLRKAQKTAANNV